MFILVKTLLFGADVPGFPSLIISVMFFAGVQLISLGVIGEYLGRVYEEVKGRPLFLVAESWESTRNRHPTRMRWPRPSGTSDEPAAAVRAANILSLSIGGTSKSMIILCADDYAMTEGVSRAIGELAAARRLSATSVLVTSRHWPRMAPRLLIHRPHLSIGLHLDLTLGPPLGAMRRLAPHGKFPPLASLATWALGGVLDIEEISAEIGRQLDHFEANLGFPPDHIDGHQHVHVLPGIRRALLNTVSKRYRMRPPLVRDPSDRPSVILSRQTATAKALSLGGLGVRLRQGSAQPRPAHQRQLLRLLLVR